MKTCAVLLSALLLAPAARAAVTLQFSNTFNRATNWLDSNGVATTQMVWGIVVDAGNNGFAEGPYVAGFSYDSSPNPVALETAAGLTDDLLVLSGSLMAVVNAPVDDATTGMNYLVNVPFIPFVSGLGTGDNFRIIWFDQTVRSGTSQIGTQYGIHEIPGAIIPSDGSTVSFSANFAGPDAAKPMSFALVPEPSHALLGLCGLALMLPRRRAVA